jgi:hypothetical protein
MSKRKQLKESKQIRCMTRQRKCEIMNRQASTKTDTFAVVYFPLDVNRMHLTKTVCYDLGNNKKTLLQRYSRSKKFLTYGSWLCIKINTVLFFLLSEFNFKKFIIVNGEYI